MDLEDLVFIFFEHFLVLLFLFEENLIGVGPEDGDQRFDFSLLELFVGAFVYIVSDLQEGVMTSIYITPCLLYC